MPPQVSLETTLSDLLSNSPQKRKEVARDKKIARLFDTRSLIEQGRVNRVLANQGFGQLHEAGLLDQLAMRVRDHNHFRQILSKLPPEKRQSCYDCLAPRLSFDARPLEHYIAETKEKCWLEETDNLPVVLGESAPPTVIDQHSSLEQRAEAAIGISLAESNARGCLTVVCKHCLFELGVLANDRLDAFEILSAMGWAFNGEDAYCPEHALEKPLA